MVLPVLEWKMASAVRRRRVEENFRIHEDVPSTEDTQVNDESMADDHEDYDEDGEDQRSDISESSAEDVVDTNVQIDMEKLQDSFPGFRHKYRLIKRIGEGIHDAPLFLCIWQRLTVLPCHRHVLNCLQGRRLAVRPL